MEQRLKVTTSDISNMKYIVVLEPTDPVSRVPVRIDRQAAYKSRQALPVATG